jgi:hypothetical protein
MLVSCVLFTGQAEGFRGGTVCRAMLTFLRPPQLPSRSLHVNDLSSFWAAVSY